MSENGNIDLNTIASNCGIGTDSDSSDTISMLEELKKKYSDIELIACFNHFLRLENRPAVLIYLLKELNRFRDTSSLEVITDLLLLKDRENVSDKDEYTNVRVLCAKIISNFKDHRSVFPLLACLNNKNDHYKVRLSCADALGRLGDKYAVVSLIDVVSDEEEKSVYIRESAAAALGMLGDVRAAESLVSILETKSGIMDKFSYLKERVIEALGKLNFNSDRVFRALKNSLSDENPQVRINAIEALMEYDDARAVELIENMLDDEDEDVARNAVVALYNINGENAMNKILQSAKTSPACKDEAQKILEEENEDMYE